MECYPAAVCDVNELFIRLVIVAAVCDVNELFIRLVIVALLRNRWNKDVSDCSMSSENWPMTLIARRSFFNFYNCHFLR